MATSRGGALRPAALDGSSAPPFAQVLADAERAACRPRAWRPTWLDPRASVLLGFSPLRPPAFNVPKVHGESWPVLRPGGVGRVQDAGLTTEVRVGVEAAAEREEKQDPTAAMRRWDGRGPEETGAAAFSTEIKTWANFVEMMGESCEFYRNLQGENVVDAVELLFAGKPTGTLAKRSSSLGLYIEWAPRSSEEPFPLREKVAYDDIRDLIVTEAPASRANVFRSTVAFVFGFLGADGAEDIMKSRRLLGGGSKAQARQKDQEEAAPLPAKAVEMLEKAAAGEVDGVSDVDRVIAGVRRVLAALPRPRWRLREGEDRALLRYRAWWGWLHRGSDEGTQDSRAGREEAPPPRGVGARALGHRVGERLAGGQESGRPQRRGGSVPSARTGRKGMAADADDNEHLQRVARELLEEGPRRRVRCGDAAHVEVHEGHHPRLELQVQLAC